MKLTRLFIPGKMTGSLAAIGMYCVGVAAAAVGADAAYGGEPSPVPELAKGLAGMKADLRAAYIGETLLPRAAEHALANVVVGLVDIVTSGAIWAAGSSYDFFLNSDIPQPVATAAFDGAATAPLIFGTVLMARVVVRLKRRGAL